MVRAILPMPEPHDYQRHVADAVAELGGELRKVELARTLLVTMQQPADVTAMLRALVRRNRLGHTYAVDLPGGRTLVGATPEMLVAKSGSTVVSNPYAGSAPRSADPVTDRANADALLASAKDQAEHRVVVEAVVEALRPYCRSLDVPATPSLTSTSAVWHLATRVTGELIDPSVTALELARVLHPTPAVCGVPTALAREAIARHEPFQRGFYGGAVGWSDENGDGRWYVAIRCAEVAGTQVRLYAGAGIMPDSQPELELAETSAKFATLLQAIGLDLPV
jgi:isochorismate synthase